MKYCISGYCGVGKGMAMPSKAGDIVRYSACWWKRAEKAAGYSRGAGFAP